MLIYQSGGSKFWPKTMEILRKWSSMNGMFLSISTKKHGDLSFLPHSPPFPPLSPTSWTSDVTLDVGITSVFRE